MATCSICTMKVVNLATHIVARHSQPTLTREGRDLPREGLGEEEEMTFTNIKMGVVGERITETLRLERFVVTTQQQYPGIMGKSKLNKTTENIEAIQMVHNDLEQYVIREEGAKILYTSSQAKRLYFKLNRKQGRSFQEVVPYQFVEKLLERYHREGLEFPCLKEEPAEDIGGNPEPSTSMSRKRKTRGFEEEGRHGPIGPDSRLATGTLMVGQGRREEEEEEDKLVRENIEFSDSSDDDEEEEEEEGETQASTRRVSTGRPLSSVDVLDNLRLRNMAGVERLANLRLRIQQQIRKNENKSP